jgi:ABC-type uncharacterized transport system permease subunit
MSALVASEPAVPPARRVGLPPWMLRWQRWSLGGLGLVAGLAVAGRIAGTPELTSQGTTGATLRFAMPILLAGLGGLWAERSGSLNIGLDGMMVVGSWTGAWAGVTWGPWWALAFGLLGGAVAGLVHAVLTLACGVDQTISGLAINLASLGVVRFLSSLTFVDDPGGSISQSPQLGDLPTVSLPGAQVALGPVGRADIPVLSDVADVLLGLTTDLSVLTVLGALAVPLTWWILWRTRAGLRIRSSGENPAAADALGVSPVRMRYLALGVSGALAGLGGAYLVVVASSVYREGQVAGRGFIGLATVVFGNWRPGGVAAGSAIFGFTDALRTRQEASVRALLLVGAVALVVLAGRELLLRRRGAGVALGLAAAGLGAWYALADTVPSELVSFAPQLTTLLVLAVARQALRPPEALGQPYRRSEAT